MIFWTSCLIRPFPTFRRDSTRMGVFALTYPIQRPISPSFPVVVEPPRDSRSNFHLHGTRQHEKTTSNSPLGRCQMIIDSTDTRNRHRLPSLVGTNDLKVYQWPSDKPDQCLIKTLLSIIVSVTERKAVNGVGPWGSAQGQELAAMHDA